MTDSRMSGMKRRHSEAWERFGKYYNPKGPFGLPHIEIGNQSFPLHFDELREGGSDDDDDEYREWLGYMIAAALDSLVKMESGNED